MKKYKKISTRQEYNEYVEKYNEAEHNTPKTIGCAAIVVLFIWLIVAFVGGALFGGAATGLIGLISLIGGAYVFLITPWRFMKNLDKKRALKEKIDEYRKEEVKSAYEEAKGKAEKFRSMLTRHKELFENESDVYYFTFKCNPYIPNFMELKTKHKSFDDYKVKREDNKISFTLSLYSVLRDVESYIEGLEKVKLDIKCEYIDEPYLNPPQIHYIDLDDIHYFTLVGDVTSQQEFYTIPGKDNGGIVMDMGGVGVYMPNKSTPPTIGSYTVENDTREVLIKTVNGDIVCEWSENIYDKLMALMPEKEYETVVELKRRKVIEKELDTNDIKSRLKVLEDLKSDGLITPDEYDEKREEILNEI